MVDLLDEAILGLTFRGKGGGGEEDFQGWETPNFFQLMHWVVGFNAKNPNFF